MYESKYARDSEVYCYYFDWDTGDLKYKKLIVTGYSYMDGVQWSVIDEYSLMEEFIEKKFLFFTKKSFVVHRIKGHIISDTLFEAKIKFIYHFLNVYGGQTSSCSKILNKMIHISRTTYDSMIQDNPEAILKFVTEKICEDNHVSFWL